MGQFSVLWFDTVLISGCLKGRLYDILPGMELTPMSPLTLKPQHHRSPVQVTVLVVSYVQISRFLNKLSHFLVSTHLCNIPVIYSDRNKQCLTELYIPALDIEERRQLRSASRGLLYIARYELRT